MAELLTFAEARVLGALIEKALTTPEVYPLSLNALRLACNQATNREPVVRFDDATVEAALDGLRAKHLAARGKAHGDRTIKHRHLADDALEVDAESCALLCLLLLRGAQTAGELKARSERLHPFASTPQVEGALDRLAGCGLAARLDRRPGQKEPRWAHRLGGDIGGGNPAGQDAGGRGGGLASRSSPTTVAPRSAPAAIVVADPATGRELRTVPVDDATEIAAKLRRARGAQAAWAERPFEQRAATLLAWRDLLEARLEESARITSEETGKVVAHARAEIRATLQRIAWFVERTPRVIAARTVTQAGDVVERVTYEPRGVVAHISAWNYPYFVGVGSIVPALACGNAVLYKPSEHATLTGLQLVDLAVRAGVPVDAFQAVVGEATVGTALVAAGVDLVCFTGSLPTGRRVALAAAERLVPVQLELGGKDAVYVCDDVDVAAAAAAVAEGAFFHAGQSCCAVERVYVHEAIWEPFVAAFVDAARGWAPGDPSLDTTAMGPLARPEHVAHLQGQVDDAVAKGARVLLGGAPASEPAYYPPTVLVDVDHTMAVMRDETFGPVIGLARVRGDEEALTLVDDSDYGLTAAVFTRDPARAERLLARCDTGSVYWNCSDRTSATLPWSGRRHSGLGVSMGDDGIRAFVRPKSWHLRP